jgi:hypothetical protein
MFFSRPIQWYHSHADPIWTDGSFILVFLLLLSVWHAKLYLNLLEGGWGRSELQRHQSKICLLYLYLFLGAATGKVYNIFM